MTRTRISREFGPIVPLDLFPYKGLSLQAKWCLLRLRGYAFGKSACWPKIATLAEDLDFSVSTTKRALKELADKEFISVRSRCHEGKSSIYTVNIHRLFEDAPRDSEAVLDEVLAEQRQLEASDSDLDEASFEADEDATPQVNVTPTPRSQMDPPRPSQTLRPETNQLKQIRERAEPPAKAPPARKLGPAVLDVDSEDPDPEAAPGRPGPALRSRERAAARPSPPSPGGPVPKTFSSERAVPREEESALAENDDVPEKPAAERLKDASEHTERLRQGLLVKRGEAFQASASKKALAGNLKSDGMSGAPAGIRASAKECQRVWFAEFEKAFPGLTIADFGAKENAQLKNLLEKYGGSIVADALRYVVREWASIRKRYFKGKLGPNPTVGWILACHEQVVTESQVWAKHAPVLQEWAEWWKKNPNNPYPPSDLKSRYREAEKELSWMDGG